MRLYVSRLATVAAVNGASPAGGCMLAMSCDGRVMTEGSRIGLNETLLGIVAPSWCGLTGYFCSCFTTTRARPAPISVWATR
jgi:enoyl-CoA hydratase/carnithine racemase